MRNLSAHIGYKTIFNNTAIHDIGLTDEIANYINNEVYIHTLSKRNFNKEFEIETADIYMK